MKTIDTTVSPEIKPLLTIAVGVYNDAKYLPGCLDSLIDQVFVDYQILISDNASTDETPSILAKYQNKYPQIHVFRQQNNIGLTGNYNFLKNKADSKYFMWAACDDRWAPNYTETILSGLQKDPSIIIGFTPFQYINEDGETFGSIRSFDYSGKSAFTRLLRFFINYYDSMVYGIYQTSKIKDCDFPVWWWINKNTPMNNAFAFLTYVLSKGQFQLFGTEPLWFNRIKGSNHFEPFRQERNVLFFLLSFIIRKANLGVVQFSNIWHGSGNFLLALVMIPVLFIRGTADVFLLLFRMINKRLPKTSPYRVR